MKIRNSYNLHWLINYKSKKYLEWSEWKKDWQSDLKYMYKLFFVE